jgi:hypothetical protein
MLVRGGDRQCVVRIALDQGGAGPDSRIVIVMFEAIALIVCPSADWQSNE